MNILGLSHSHGDSSAALIVDGKLVAAVEEERFSRIKHDAGFPSEAIRYCLQHAGIGPEKVHAIALARRPWNAFWRRLRFFVRHPNLYRNKKISRGGEEKKNVALPPHKQLAALGLKSARLYRVEHHLAHLYSSRCLAPQEPMALMSLDGLGDFVSTSMGIAENHSVKLLKRIYFPNSLGFFYTAMTQYLGFPYFGDEYKVMGLSSYGSPTYLEEMRKLVRVKPGFSFFLNLEAFPLLNRGISFSIRQRQPSIGPLYNASFLTQLFGVLPRREYDPLTTQHENLAKSVQTRFEEVATHLLTALAEQVPHRTLGLSGGCAHNSVWVGKILKTTPFRKICVAPASNDAGIAVGAALKVANQPVEVEGGHWALLGPGLREVSGPSHFDSLEQRDFRRPEELIRYLVDELCDGKLVGVCLGRMEFGPRALGNRSILCDPRVAEMKNIINLRVKHREPFRPFAASVLCSKVEEWFEDAYPAHSMEAVFKVRSRYREKIPAVLHADNSCRIQAVEEKTQPFFSKLLESFYERTGVPMLLNTSFNDREPIVCSESDAIRCFLATECDHLLLENRLLSRSQSHPKVAAGIGRS